MHMIQVLHAEYGDIVVGQISAKALDAGNSRALKQSIAPLLSRGGKLVIDLSRIEFIDSSGLGALVSCLRQAHSSGGDIKLCGLMNQARALFELVRMHRVFEVFNSPEEAVTSYGALPRCELSTGVHSI
jgi:anti-sigma B factor antagonist